MSRVQPGCQVRYYQPSVDEILDSWAGKRRRGKERGELITTTVASVSVSGGVTYITATDGMMLTESDVREVL